MKQVRSIARRFDLPEPFKISDFPWKGNVNYSTYLVKAGQPGSRHEYLLQNLNADVFADPGAVMDTMIACLQAQEKAISHVRELGTAV